MTEEEKLYETLGELLYAVAKADGVIQDEEKAAMNNLLKGHPWEKQINWSFEYEASKEPTVEEIYTKVISYCQHYGPAPQYDEFINAMKIIAEASGGMDDSESKIIESFSSDLIKKFMRDIES
ncbi:MAG: TerB family tellurite resistance protein [Bacteroidota bacterium]